MGTVFRAQAIDSGQPRAIKLLSDALDPAALLRFRREAEAMSRLEHPDLVKVHDWGTEQGRPYLVMDLLPGGSLHDRLRREGPLPADEAAELIARLADAMAFAHARGVIHRDIKPANVLLRDDGSPVLTDFGLARLLGRKTRLTQTGDLLGSPGYMAPEQATGDHRAVGPATDIYAVGVTLYECLTGSLPFQGKSVLELLEQVVHAAPVSPADRCPGLDPVLARICLRCLEKSPADRYASAAALAEALRGRAPPPPSGRAPRLAILLVAGALLAALLIVVLRAEPVPDPSPAPTVRAKPTPAPDAPASPTAIETTAPSLPEWVESLPPSDRPPAPLPSGIRYGAAPGELVHERTGSILLWIPPGEVTLPGLAGERRLTRVSGFFLGKHEVSLGQVVSYRAEAGIHRASPSDLRELADYPAQELPWSLAAAYCSWAGGRLPTEAEWRRAAFGDDGRSFPWGAAPPGDEVGVFGGERPRLVPVEGVPQAPSAWGCLGMGGNVAEWTSDWLAPLPGDLPLDPRGPPLAELSQQEPLRVIMGSSGAASADLARWTARRGVPPETLDERHKGVGFRLCVPATATPRVSLGPWRVQPYTFPPPPASKLPPPPGEPDALLAASEPFPPFEVDRLQFIWKGGGPGHPYEDRPALSPGLPADGYGLRARTTVDLPAGRWLLHTISDDGLRLYVDGELVLEDWTHHGNRILQHDFDVREARTVTIELDYFENFGWASLWVELLPG
jgi:serine/threonine protein kinase